MARSAVLAPSGSLAALHADLVTVAVLGAALLLPVKFVSLWINCLIAYY